MAKRTKKFERAVEPEAPAPVVSLAPPPPPERRDPVPAPVTTAVPDPRHVDVCYESSTHYVYKIRSEFHGLYSAKKITVPK